MPTKSTNPSTKRRMNPKSLENLKNLKGNDDDRSVKVRNKAIETKEKLAEQRRRDRQELAEQQPKDSAQDFWKAVRKGDIRKVQCYEIAFKIKGSTFDQSEERVQNFRVNSEVQTKRDVIINFRQATPEDAK